jgi:hypothetical protein
MTATSPLPPALPARPRRRRRIIAAILIFLGGMICGAGLTVIVAVHNIRHAIHHPEEVPARITRYLTRRLDLTDDQASQVEALIAQRQANLQAIRRETQPRVAAELTALRAEIGQVLTPDQRDKWDEIFDEAIDRWMPPPPPAPPSASTTQPS